MVQFNRSDPNYWKMRRGMQWGRFGKKLGNVYEKRDVNSVAQAAWSGVKYLRTLVNSEVHKHDVGPTSQTVGTTATIVQLNAIAQGDTAAQRTGQSILAKYLAIKFSLTTHATPQQTLVRIILFMDKQQVADTAPGTTDLLSSNSTFAFLNNQASGRFQVIKDWFVEVDPASKPCRTWKFYKKYAGSNLHCKYNGVNNTDIQKNGIYLLMLSSEATNTPTLTYATRFGFHDN